MRRNIIVAAVSAVIIGLGITFQIFGTASHETKQEPPASGGQTTEAPATPGPSESSPPEAPSTDDSTTATPAAPGGEREEGETNNEDGGKPGEAPKG